MNADPFVHYTNKELDILAPALCGKPWEWLTDVPAKVTCPDCKQELAKCQTLNTAS